MRILVAHNLYGTEAPSGENQVFELEKAMLESRGHEVRSFVRHSDALRRLGARGVLVGGLATPWNPLTPASVRRSVAMHRPDVVHVHNTFPLISPAIFSGIGQRAARVLTLHNYRLFCPAAIPLRAGRPCTDCMDRRSVIPAMVHGCYRRSRLATAPLALGVALHRWLRTWQRHVDAFIALTEFQRDRMVAAGLPADRVWVKPNFYRGTPAVVDWSKRSGVVCAGRLSQEKGVGDLVEAWVAWGESAPPLTILGDGPLRSSLERRLRVAGAHRVRLLGRVDSASAERAIAHARLIVVPSICFEGFPMVIREAFAFGTPAAVSDVGPLPALVEDGRTGVVFAPGAPDSLLAAVRAAWQDQARLRQMSLRARGQYEARYAEDSNHATLLSIYDRAIAVHRERYAA